MQERTNVPKIENGSFTRYLSKIEQNLQIIDSIIKRKEPRLVRILRTCLKVPNWICLNIVIAICSKEMD